MDWSFGDINHKKQSFDEDIFYYIIPYGDGRMSGFDSPTVFKSPDDVPDHFRGEEREVIYLPSLSSPEGPRSVIFAYKLGYYHQWLELFSSILREVEKTTLNPTDWEAHIVTPVQWVDEYQRETLEFFCDKILERFGVSVIPTYVGGAEGWRSKDLIAITNADVIYEAQENVTTYQKLREFIQSFPETREIVKGKNAYLLRETNQRIENEEKVVEFFRGKGFEIISSEVDFKSFKDQISYFSSLDCLASPTGSGLINMMYMSDNSTVVELVTPLELTSIDYVEGTNEEIITTDKSFHNHYSGMAFASNINYLAIPHDRNPDTVISKVSAFNPFKQ